VVRARTPCVVRVAPAGAGLRIDVEDDCPCPMPIPGRGPVDLACPRAVGLRLVGGLTAAWVWQIGPRASWCGRSWSTASDEFPLVPGSAILARLTRSADLGRGSE
jgi:hypothetical protein